MRITSRKKEILTFFNPESLEWVKGEIGSPPLDVGGVAYLLHGTEAWNKRHHIESTRRTLESMVKDGLLEKVAVYERRANKHQASTASPGVRCMVSRYGLPGQCSVISDDGEGDYIDGECARVSDAL